MQRRDHKNHSGKHEHQRQGAIFDQLVRNSVYNGEQRQTVRQSLNGLPVLAAEEAQRRIARNSEQYDEDEGSDEARVVGEPEPVVSQAHRPVGLGDQKVFEWIAEVNLKTDRHMNEGDDRDPDPDIPSEIG